MTVENSTKIQILNEYRPYLRLLKAYNVDNFRQNGQRQNYYRSVFDAFFTTFIIVIMSSHLLFDIWYIIDYHTDLKKVVTLFPLTMTTLQIWVSFIAFLLKNGTITEMIDRLQSVVEQRKFLFRLDFVVFSIYFL